MSKQQMKKGTTYFLTIFMAFGLIMLLGNERALAADAKYVGYTKCKGCHLKQYKAWKKKKHSEASLSLKAEE